MHVNEVPLRKIFRKDEIFIFEAPKKIATKYKIKGHHYMSGADEGFIKMAQDLIKGKINKSSTTGFISFKNRGNVTFLDLPCQSCEYSFASSASKNKIKIIVYHDICLSK